MGLEAGIYRDAADECSTDTDCDMPTRLKLNKFEHGGEGGLGGPLQRPLCEQNDKQTQTKALPSHNFVGGL